MRNRERMFHFCALFFALLAASSAARATTLRVRILDESGFPAAARVYLTDGKGESYFPAGALVYNRMNWNVSEKHFFPPEGSFSIELPENTYTLRIERGKEYLPIQENIALPNSGKVEKEYRLQLWVNMANRGWYSADMHAHVSLRDVPVLLDGEDLNVLLPITMWRVSFVPAYQDPLLEDRGAVHGTIRKYTGPRAHFAYLFLESEPANSNHSPRCRIHSRADREPNPGDPSRKGGKRERFDFEHF
jgi:hypothetical protein